MTGGKDGGSCVHVAADCWCMYSCVLFSWSSRLASTRQDERKAEAAGSTLAAARLCGVIWPFHCFICFLPLCVVVCGVTTIRQAVGIYAHIM